MLEYALSAHLNAHNLSAPNHLPSGPIAKETLHFITYYSKGALCC